MRNQLVETSSIFSEPKKEINKGDALIPSKEEEYVEDIKDNELCKVLHFTDHTDDAKITLETFLPDSLYCVIQNKYSGLFFAGHMKKEFIYEVPITRFKVEFTTADLVILQVHILGEEPDSLKFMILEKDTYRLVDNYTCVIKNDQAIIDGEPHSRFTTEVTESKYSPKENVRILTYEHGSFITKRTNVLLYEGSDSKTKILLADENGSYIGYYLPLNLDGHVHLHGNSYKMVSRLTLTIAVVELVENGHQFILTCLEQMLISFSDFKLLELSNIGVLNGIALLFDGDIESKILNVFTPNHQRIILEPGYKVDSDAVGNGIYFAEDNVLLLDNGSLIFTKKINHNTLEVRGKRVTLPIPYLGEV